MAVLVLNYGFWSPGHENAVLQACPVDQVLNKTHFEKGLTKNK